MPSYNQSELNSIREMVIAHQTTASKLSSYSEQCNDAHLKQMFGQAANEARQSAQNLIKML